MKIPELTVLKDINLSLKRGQTLGIIGKTGFRKIFLSLFNHALIGPPTQGEIRIDGEKLSDIDLSRLAKLVRLCSSRAFFFFPIQLKTTSFLVLTEMTFRMKLFMKPLETQESMIRS